MKTYEQLEINLWRSLDQARQVPLDQAVDFNRLCDELEGAIAGQEIQSQLQVAGDGLLEFFELFHQRCTLRFELIAARNAKDGPVMAANAFDRYVRQSVDVDFDRYLDPLSRKAHDYPDERASGSMVGEMDRDELLELLEESAIDSGGSGRGAGTFGRYWGMGGNDSGMA